ncbi:MAG: hypothetical protein ACTTI3_07720 [Treponema sp.]
MKKTLGCILLLLVFASGIAVSENKAGLNKLGIVIGYPSGLSYSHNFTKKDQLDLTLAYWYWARSSTFNLAIGYLRTIVEPRINSTVCPLELGAGLEVNPSIDSSSTIHMTMGLYVDLRWEIFFAGIPNFNVFLDFAPRLNFWTNGINLYGPRGGVGVRLAF